MVWLLVRDKRNSYSLYSPSTYGMETWGSTSQDSIERKSKYWYFYTWRAGGDWQDDYKESIKINVVCESTNIDDILYYLAIHSAKPEVIKQILDTAKKEFEAYVEFNKWGLRLDRPEE